MYTEMKLAVYISGALFKSALRPQCEPLRSINNMFPYSNFKHFNETLGTWQTGQNFNLHYI